ncbi:MAG: hypothetical protein HY474_01980 [Candidatus Sungbacteria bacterium]|uniref:Uncharacterized protein n=1 Tax=Candidatus Sungiibacteriota bacterium TaxID=2750080 RepID=A0A932YY33_9BACT|nr:hypothetical protein [Candidatus Sungbacteria bacterium]
MRVAQIDIRRRGAAEPAASLAVGRRLFGHPAFFEPKLLERGLRFFVPFEAAKLKLLPDEEHMTLTLQERVLLRLRTYLTAELGEGWDLDEVIILEGSEAERVLASLATQTGSPAPAEAETLGDANRMY